MERQFAVRDLIVAQKQIKELSIETNFNIEKVFVGKHFKYDNIVYEISAVISIDTDEINRMKYGILFTNIIFFKKSRFPLLFKAKLENINRYSYALSQKEIERFFI